uniref:Transmembrane protein n=1 Tax=Medicago truncatula TaxID=3880 RepID=I3SVD6_MEDTR|nr:unknown [Medicago truncatula]
MATTIIIISITLSLLNFFSLLSLFLPQNSSNLFLSLSISTFHLSPFSIAPTKIPKLSLPIKCLPSIEVNKETILYVFLFLEALKRQVCPCNINQLRRIIPSEQIKPMKMKKKYLKMKMNNGWTGRSRRRWPCGGDDFLP